MSADDSPTPAKPKKTVSRVVYAAYVSVAGAFIVWSTVQITRAVFSGSSGDDTAATRSTVTPACADGIRKLTTAVDRAVAAAALGHDAADATRRYRAARSPEWDDPQRGELLSACTGDQGSEAAAAVTRFDRAAEGAAGREAGELGSVRRTVDSFIR